jgi:hypothetical protein
MPNMRIVRRAAREFVDDLLEHGATPAEIVGELWGEAMILGHAAYGLQLVDSLAPLSHPLPGLCDLLVSLRSMVDGGQKC